MGATSQCASTLFKASTSLFSSASIIMCFNRYRWLALSRRLRLGSRRKRRLKPHAVWHLDEVYLKIDGRVVSLWRAVDAEGEVLDVLVQSSATSAPR